jgi:hypothetical protein
MHASAAVASDSVTNRQRCQQAVLLLVAGTHTRECLLLLLQVLPLQVLLLLQGPVPHMSLHALANYRVSCS